MEANYRARLGAKLPLSPQKEADDSLEMVDMSREGPEPIELDPQNYELTFKKNQRERYFVAGKQEVESSLLSVSERQMLHYLSQPLTYYYTLPLQQLSSLPFADLYSLDLQQKHQRKLTVIGEILQLKRLQAKNRSVGINLRCMSLKQNVSHEEKNKMYLLELLQKQLNKKQFISALRLNFIHNRYISVFGDESEIVEYQPTNPELAEKELQEEQSVEQEREWGRDHEHWERPLQDEEQNYHLQSQIEGQLLILTQVISGITKRVLFSALNSISNTVRHSVRSNRVKPHPLQAEELSPIPTSYKKEIIIKSPEALSNENINQEEGCEMSLQQPQSESVEDEQEFKSGQSKLAELAVYMEELHEECAETGNMARKYFLKWKIFLLEAIAQSMISHLQQQEEELDGSLREGEPHGQQSGRMAESSKIDREHFSIQEQEHFSQQELEQHQQPEDSPYNWSRQTSQISSFQSPLKQEKRQLKDFIFSSQARVFFSNFRVHFESRRIRSIIDEVRLEKLLKKGFSALKINLLEGSRMRNMDDYYQEVACSQEQDDNTAFFFWKTNLLHKYFKQLSQCRRNAKMFKAMTEITMKIVFRIVKVNSLERRKNHQTLERWIDLKEKKQLFKFFSHWKQQHRSSSGHFQNVRIHKIMKQKQIMGHCFSILKLQYKKMLIKLFKAQRFHNEGLQTIAFQSLRTVTEQGRDLRDKEYSLHEYLAFKRSNQFIHNLQIFYEEYTRYQRFSVREEKLKRTLLELHGLRAVKQWRAAHMKKSAYSAIEARLTRLKQKQRKRQILNIWMKKALGEMSSSRLSGSDKHKEWLVQYYSGLCSVYQE